MGERVVADTCIIKRAVGHVEWVEDATLYERGKRLVRKQGHKMGRKDVHLNPNSESAFCVFLGHGIRTWLL
jgi:hypothetical protein